MSRVKNGSIILCHNGAKYTAQALDTMITTLKEQGYEFVPLSELIYKDNYHMNQEGSQIPDYNKKTHCISNGFYMFCY